MSRGLVEVKRGILGKGMGKLMQDGLLKEIDERYL